MSSLYSTWSKVMGGSIHWEIEIGLRLGYHTEQFPKHWAASQDEEEAGLHARSTGMMNGTH